MSNGEFMHVSNSILVLKEILPVFPLGMIQASAGQFLDDTLQNLLSEEKRGDIKLLATSYQGQLRLAKREWAGPSDQASGGAEVILLMEPFDPINLFIRPRHLCEPMVILDDNHLLGQRMHQQVLLLRHVPPHASLRHRPHLCNTHYQPIPPVRGLPRPLTRSKRMRGFPGY